MFIPEKGTDLPDVQKALAELATAIQGVADRAANDCAHLQAQIDQMTNNGLDGTPLQEAAAQIETRVIELNQLAADTSPIDLDAPAAVVEGTTVLA